MAQQLFAPAARLAAARAAGASTPRAFAAAAAAGASPVDQMIEFAMQQRQANPNLAVDVLRSGLSFNNVPSGQQQQHAWDAARLHLALAQIEASRDGWTDAAAAASRAMRSAIQAPLVPAAAELAMEAGDLAARALLLQGHDADAVEVAAECEIALARSPSDSAAAGAATASSASAGAAPLDPQRARSSALHLLAVHATGAGGGEAAAVAANAVAAALGGDAAATARGGGPAAADAAAALGLWRAARGQTEDAAALLTAAAAAARGAAAAAPEWARRQHHHEVEAEALAAAAQLRMAAKEWGDAEEMLGRALKAAEAAHGERSPALAPLLTLLGYTYSRSARVTFAEGLFREAAKLLHLDPARSAAAQHAAEVAAAAAAAGGQQAPHDAPQRALHGAHASVGALLSWRYAQLLWVLPNRGGEAGSWERCALRHWAASGSALAASDAAAVLGGRGHLKGEDVGGAGLLLSARLRRVLPPLGAIAGDG